MSTFESGSSRRRSGRPTTSVVSRRSAVEAAVRIIDEQGLDHLSIREIGRALGVTSGSLYHYFADKDEILLEVVKFILRDVRAVPNTADRPRRLTWQHYVIEPTTAIREALLAHPNAAPLLVRRPKQSFAHDVVNDSIAALARAGVPANLQLPIFRAAEMLAFASALLDDHADDNRGYGDVADRHTALQKAINSDTSTSDESFALILDAVLTGFNIGAEGRAI